MINRILQDIINEEASYYDDWCLVRNRDPLAYEDNQVSLYAQAKLAQIELETMKLKLKQILGILNAKN